MNRRDVRRNYTDGPFGQIHFRDHGDGDPLILLHQAPMTSRQFDNVFQPLAARGIRAIAIDVPGFGGSDAPRGVPSVEDYALCVEPVLDALSLHSSALLGHHTGVLVATEVALRIPTRVSALILNGPMPLTEEERQQWLRTGHQRELSIEAKEGASHLTDYYARRNMLADGSIPPDRLAEYVIGAFTGEAPFWHGHYAAYMYRQAEKLPDVPMKALILTNSGDVIFPKAQIAHQIRPDFDLVALDGGGIDIVDQQPEAWSDAVRAYLDKVLR